MGLRYRYVSLNGLPHDGFKYVQLDYSRSKDDAGDRSRLERLTPTSTVRGPNPGVGEIFRAFPDRPRVQHSLLYTYNRYRVSLGIKMLKPGTDHPATCNAETATRLRLSVSAPQCLIRHVME
jgi:hypothetical protein